MATPARDASPAQVTLLAELLVELAQVEGLDALAETLTKRAKWVIPGDACVVLLRDDDGVWCVYPGAVPIDAGTFPSSVRLALDQRAVVSATTEPDDAREPVLISNARSVLVLPLVGSTGAMLGAIVFSTRAADAYARQHPAIHTLLRLNLAALVLTQRILEQERKHRQQAEAAVRTRDRVLTVVSHDLRTPLTTIKLATQTLRRQLRPVPPGLDDTLARGLSTIETAVGRLNRQIEDLLDAARLAAGQHVVPRPESVDLVRLAADAVADLQTIAPDHSVILERDLPALVGEWDPVRIRRVLDNLLGNAVKYAPAGTTVVVRVTASREASGAWATVSVQDQGRGIPAADLPHIFEPFYRASNVDRRTPGIGIGLSGSKQSVEQHGGTLSVTSEVGRGTTFTVRLPLPADVPPEAGR